MSALRIRKLVLAVMTLAALLAPETAGIAGAQTPPTIPSAGAVAQVEGSVQPTPFNEEAATEAGRRAGAVGGGGIARGLLGEGPGTAPSPAPAGAGAANPPAVQHSGMMLDVEGVSTDAGARVIQWPANGQIHQMWRLVPVGATGTFNIVAQHSNMSLDVGGVSRDDGALIIQWPTNGGTNQMWRPAVSGL